MLIAIPLGIDLLATAIAAAVAAPDIYKTGKAIATAMDAKKKKEDQKKK